MDNVVGKFCDISNTEQSIENFLKKYRECKQCSTKRVLKRYYDNKDGILQKRRDKYARFKDLDNRLKALKEKLSVNSNLS